MHIYNKLKRTSFILLLPVGSLIAQTDSDSQAEAITYTQALQRAIAADPRLELNLTLAEAAEGQIEQADLSPNPVIGTEVEDFLGTGPITGVQGLEVTLGISQLIETADKREKRTALAHAKRSLIDWERENLLAQVEASVRSAFVNALLAQELLDLRREQLILAERSAEETARLVKAARSPQVEQTRAQLAVKQQSFALQQAERELTTAKSILASLWGELEDVQFNVTGKVVLLQDTPNFDTLVSKLTETAVLARYSAEKRTREAALDLEQARANPDFQVFAGSRYFNAEDGDVGFIAGIQVPWPLFDRNQGNIRTAQAQLRVVEHEREAVRRELLINLNQAYQQLLGAQADAAIIQSELLPASEATLRDTEKGYQQGQFTQLTVLESRRALFEIREAYLDALRRYGTAQAQIKALTQPANL